MRKGPEAAAGKEERSRPGPVHEMFETMEVAAKEAKSKLGR
jgi:hypothetical protein